MYICIYVCVYIHIQREREMACARPAHPAHEGVVRPGTTLEVTQGQILSQMPPDSGGICVDVDCRNHQYVPGSPPGWCVCVRERYGAVGERKQLQGRSLKVGERKGRYDGAREIGNFLPNNQR